MLLFKKSSFPVLRWRDCEERDETRYRSKDREEKRAYEGLVEDGGVERRWIGRGKREKGQREQR